MAYLNFSKTILITIIIQTKLRKYMYEQGKDLQLNM